MLLLTRLVQPRSADANTTRAFRTYITPTQHPPQSAGHPGRIATHGRWCLRYPGILLPRRGSNIGGLLVVCLWSLSLHCLVGGPIAQARWGRIQVRVRVHLSLPFAGPRARDSTWLHVLCRTQLRALSDVRSIKTATFKSVDRKLCEVTRIVTRHCGR